MPDDNTFRGDGPWGAGKDAPLSAGERDANFHFLDQRLDLLGVVDGTPALIEGFEVEGDRFRVHLEAESEPLGPFPLPIAAVRWRGLWQAGDHYKRGDVVVVIGRGLYEVMAEHVSPPRFRPTYSANGRRAYRLRFELPPPEGLIGVRHIVGSYTIARSDAHRMLNFPTTALIQFPSPQAIGMPVGAELAVRQGSELQPLVLNPAPDADFSDVQARLFATDFAGAVVHAKAISATGWDLWGDLQET